MLNDTFSVIFKHCGIGWKIRFCITKNVSNLNFHAESDFILLIFQILPFWMFAILSDFQTLCKSYVHLLCQNSNTCHLGQYWGHQERLFGMQHKSVLCMYCASYAYFSVSSLHITDVVPYRKMRPSAAKDKSACGCINTNLSFQEQHLKVFL